MEKELFSLHQIWNEQEKQTIAKTEYFLQNFEDLASKLVSMGPYYYYIIDFSDMSLFNVSDSIIDIQGFNPKEVTLNDIINSIHPEDMEFVVTTENAIRNFYHTKLQPEQFLNYKMNYSFRAKMADGNYAILNHQAILLALDQNGGVLKSLNIHTRIDHITEKNNYKYSLIGIDGEPSYMNIGVYESEYNLTFSNREIEIIKLLAEGYDSKTIGDKLFISDQTVKKHRSNILKKACTKNSSQLIKKAILSGLI